MMKEKPMLSDSKVFANIPASDLQRAREFYSQTLGHTPAEEHEGMLAFTTSAGTTFLVYETEHAGKASHTIAQWHVEDLEAEVRDLQAKGVIFEQYDMPDVSWSNGIASAPGMGRAAWFKDSEGNTMCLDDA